MLIKQLFAGRLPQLVLFDLDGTLVDSVPDLAQAVDQMLQALGRPVAGEAKVRTWVGNGAAMLVKRALADSMQPSYEDAEFDRAYALFLQFYGAATAESSQLYPGATACLSALADAGVAMGLVTNKPITFTRTMLESFDLDRYFQVVLGGDCLAQKKPSPEPLLEAAKRCGADISQTLMVGDSKSDLAAARAANCPVACVPYGYNHGLDIADFKPDLLVEQLDQLTQ